MSRADGGGRRRVAVLGSGSWGTALAVYLARLGLEVALWSRDRRQAEALARERVNEKYLPGVELPAGLSSTAELAELAADAVLVVVPSHGYRQVLAAFLAAAPASRALVVISCTKGVEPGSLARMSAVTAEEATRASRDARFAVLSGPTFAAELAAGMPSAAVVACEDEELAAALREDFSSPTLRLYSSGDVTGVELGGAVKNVIAVAAGVVTGLGFGHNTLAALITRGLHEAARLGVACGGEPRTFSGLAGLGDLVLTCTGGLSRNRRTGIELARGKTLEEIERETAMVAEGIRNSRALSELAASLGVEMPITEQMRRVLYEGQEPRRALEELMTRDRKDEAEL